MGHADNQVSLVMETKDSPPSFMSRTPEDVTLNLGNSAARASDWSPRLSQASSLTDYTHGADARKTPGWCA